MTKHRSPSVPPLGEQDNLRALFDALEDLLFVLDDQGRILHVNPAVENRLGYSIEELRGASVLEVHPPDRHEEALEILARMMSGQASLCPIPLMTKTGERVPAETKVARGRWNGRPALFGISRDTSERLHAEEARRNAHEELEQRVRERTAELAQANERLQAEIREHERTQEQLSLFRQFIEASGEGMGWAALDGSVRYLNPALTRMVGEKKAEDSYGKPVQRYYSSETQQRLRDEIFPYILQDRIWSGELELLSLTGRAVTTANSLFILRDADGQPVSFANVVTDLTEQKRVEQELKQYRHHLEERVAQRTRDLEKEIADRRAAEESVRASKDMLQLVMDNIPHYVFWKDRNSVYLGCNHRFARVAGVEDPDAIIGKTDFDLPWKHPEPGYYRDCDRRVIDSGVPEVHRIEPRQRHDGMMRWLDTSKIPIRDRAGRVIGILGTYEDITDRREAEAMMRRLETAVGQSIDGILMADLEGNIEYVNPAWARMHGFEVSEVLGKHVRLFHTEGQMKLDLQPFIERTLRSGAAEDELMHRRRDGSLFPAWQTANCFKDDQGAPIGIVAVARDISQQRLAEEERARLISILEETSDLVGIATIDLHIAYMNRAGRSMLGWDQHDDIEGRPLSDVHPKWAVDLIGKEGIPAAVRGESWVGETALLRPDGSEIPVSQVIMSHRAADGTLSHLSTIARDITEQKLAEEKLEERVRERTADLESALRELESFSYSVSHDLRAPLRAINGFSQIILEDQYDRLDETGREYLTRVCSATTRMGQLIDDMLELSRIVRHEPRLVSIDMTGMVQTIVGELHETHPDRSVQVVIAPDVRVRGDEHLIRATMRNLLENAFKYTSRNPAARIEFGVEEIEGRRAFFVKDNGVGFDMSYQDQLFAAFTRLHSDEEFAGTGIGLSIAHRAISKHRGRIWAEAEEGKGAIFRFTIE